MFQAHRNVKIMAGKFLQAKRCARSVMQSRSFRQNPSLPIFYRNITVICADVVRRRKGFRKAVTAQQTLHSAVDIIAHSVRFFFVSIGCEIEKIRFILLCLILGAGQHDGRAQSIRVLCEM